MAIKHAYLIIAHNNWSVLERLLVLLDDNRNDIYLHIDKKVPFPSLVYKLQKAKIIILNKVNVKWGGVSQIEVELLLFKEAYKSKEHYLYYHLISGTDMPLKTQDEIHSFFFYNYPKEFIGFLLNESCEDRINKVYLFPKHQRVKNVVIRKFLSVLRHAFVFIQKCFRYNHYKLNDRLIMGANWVSITEKAVEVILQNEDKIMKQYKYSSCADEVYKQTIIMNSALFDNVYNKDDCYNGCMRLIDWKRGKPYIFRSGDYNQLISSNKMFARKFDEDVDFNIVEKIFWTLSKN